MEAMNKYLYHSNGRPFLAMSGTSSEVGRRRRLVLRRYSEQGLMELLPILGMSGVLDWARQVPYPRGASRETRRAKEKETTVEIFELNP